MMRRVPSIPTQWLFPRIGPVRGGGDGLAPPPSAPFQAVNADGWSVAASDAVAAVGQSATVTRQGFSATGAAVSVADSLSVLSRVRLPYPDQATLTADQVSLSDFVYAGDAISGVTNSSARPYPKPIAMWLNHDLERATSATHTLRLAVAHAHARNGRPVAAVKFTVSDGTTTVEQLVSVMSVATYASGLSVPHFAATMDLSTLTAGVLVTVDAVIYPWVGEAFTISVDADAYSSSNLSTLRLLNDRDGSFGTVYAYVDAVVGNNTTGVASVTPATAAASPFLTIAAAVTAIRAANNASFGRDQAGGGVVRLVEGVHNSSPFRTAAGTTTVPLVIEAADPAKVATTVYLGPTASTNSSIPTHTEFRNITLRKQGASIVFLDGTNSVNGLLVFKGCAFDLNGTAVYNGWLYRVGRVWFIECSGSAGQAATFSTAYKTSITIGSGLGSISSSTYHAVASRASAVVVAVEAAPRPAAVGAFWGWNVFSRNATGAMFQCAQTVGPRGIAVVGTVMEGWGGFTDPIMQINADNSLSPCENIVLQMNTCVGERANLLYLEFATNADKSAYVSHNIFQLMNIKGDVFATNGVNVGNWPARYKVGWPRNMAFRGSNNGGFYGPAGWTGEVAGVGEFVDAASPWPDMAWADDRSNLGASTGGGDYTPGAGTAVISVPAGQAPFSHDLMGRAIPDDGTAFVGALQAA